MKHLFLFILLLSSTLHSFSQPTNAASLKELNDIKEQRSQLGEKLSKLEIKFSEKQILIDSCRRKLDEVRDQADKLKHIATGKDKRVIAKKEKEIGKINIAIKDILKSQSEIGDMLGKARNLIKVLDNKIIELSRELE